MARTENSGFVLFCFLRRGVFVCLLGFFVVCLGFLFLFLFFVIFLLFLKIFFYCCLFVYHNYCQSIFSEINR